MSDASIFSRLRRLAGGSNGAAATEALSKLNKTLSRLDKRIELLARQSHDNQLVLRRVIRLLEEQTTRGDAAAPVGAAPGPAVAPSRPDEWQELTACPLCGHGSATVVSEYNRFLLADTAPDETSKIYNYSLCHGCGVVYAARRPVGRRYHDLLNGFHENLGRVGTISAWLNPSPLTADEREQIRSRARPGALISEHADRSDKEWMPGAFRDRLAVAPHIELIGSLLTLDKPRVLEIRSRTGAILDALRRQYGATVYSLPIFESQQELVRSLYDIPADRLVDFERFEIPYDGPFDLIVSNHMMTHAVAPGAFLDTVSAALAPGGHLYLYNEMDEGEYLATGKSMFAVLNPFHMQLYNRQSLVRALAARGFETTFFGHSDHIHMMCMAKKTAPAVTLMPDAERKRRLRQYATARQVSILLVPEDRRGLFAAEWDGIVEEAVAAGAATLDEDGRPRVTRSRNKGGDAVPYDDSNA